MGDIDGFPAHSWFSTTRSQSVTSLEQWRRPCRRVWSFHSRDHRKAWQNNKSFFAKLNWILMIKQTETGEVTWGSLERASEHLKSKHLKVRDYRHHIPWFLWMRLLFLLLESIQSSSMTSEGQVESSRVEPILGKNETETEMGWVTTCCECGGFKGFE